MKVLITGADGFVGGYLFEHLNSLEYEVFGTYFLREIKSPNHMYLDITDKESALRCISKIKPDIIYHLAGFSSVGKSFEQPKLCYDVNAKGTENLLKCIVNTSLNPKILVISSGEAYGPPNIIPIPESHPLNPKSPYGVSRVAQEKICKEYISNYDLDIIVTRSFNHTGPKQQDAFAIPNFAKQIAMIEAGSPPVIKTGNLSAIRDFSDVRDIIKAYVALVGKGKPREVYNVCSGKGFSIKELLNKLIEISGKEIRTEVDENRLRAVDIPRLIGDNRKIVSQTGWKPNIDIKTTLKDILDYWRNII